MIQYNPFSLVPFVKNLDVSYCNQFKSLKIAVSASKKFWLDCFREFPQVEFAR